MWLWPLAYLIWGAAQNTLGPNPAETLIRSSGEMALRMMCVALAVTPLRILSGWPEWARFRRMLGLLTYLYACLHLTCYALFDMGLDLQEIATDVLKRPFIWVGLSAWLLLSAMAATSFNRAVRWLGAARRAHDVALAHARSRTAFGKPLGEHEGVGFMLADNELDLHTARLSIWHCAWVLDQGGKANTESSMTKVIASEAIYRIVDRCVQILGGQGVTGETIVERIWRDVRPFRIYDGPSEVHRWSLAKHLLKGHSAATEPAQPSERAQPAVAPQAVAVVSPRPRVASEATA